MKNIVVVDDDPQVVDLVVGTLTPEGYKVVTAAGGEEALTQADPERSCLLILGESLPDRGGREAVRRLNASARPRVIVLTLPSPIKDGDFGWPRGAVDMYLTKPFNPKELASFVRRLYTNLDGGN